MAIDGSDTDCSVSPSLSSDAGEAFSIPPDSFMYEEAGGLADLDVCRNGIQEGLEFLVPETREEADSIKKGFDRALGRLTPDSLKHSMIASSTDCVSFVAILADPLGILTCRVWSPPAAPAVVNHTHGALSMHDRIGHHGPAESAQANPRFGPTLVATDCEKNGSEDRLTPRRGGGGGRRSPRAVRYILPFGIIVLGLVFAVWTHQG